NGDFKGFSCLSHQQCTNGSVSGTCASTGKSCEDNTAFAGFSCVDDSECCTSGSCPAGSCTGAGSTTGTPAPTVATNTPQPTETPLPATPTPNVSILAEGASSTAESGGCAIDPQHGSSIALGTVAVVLAWVAHRKRLPR